MMSEHWTESTLEDVSIKITDGSHNPPKGVDNSDYRMLSSRNIFNDKINFDKFRYLTKDAYEKENRRTNIAAGDVLLSIVGTIGRVAVVEEDILPFTLQRSVAVIKPDLSKIDSRYLMYCLMSMSNDLNSQSRGAAQKGIYLKQLRSFTVKYPDLEEQQRVVSILDEAFENINQSKEQTMVKRNDAIQLFRSALFSIIEECRISWESEPLENLLIEERKISYGVLKPGPHIPDGVRLIKSQQVRDGFMNLDADFRISKELDESYKKTRIQGGEILLNLVGASIGRSAIAPPIIEGANVSRAIAVIPVIPDFAEWVQYCLSGPQGQDIIQSKTGGSAQPVLNLGEVKTILIPILPEDERELRINKLDRLFAQTRKLEMSYSRELESFEELKQSILQEVFTGNLTKEITA
jgi:type I restriction enzyme, S subunit